MELLGVEDRFPAAGISFTLADLLNLADYAHIELAAEFTNSQCDLFLKGANGADNFITISETSPAAIRSDFRDGK
jgi:hypothetical protein